MSTLKGWLMRRFHLLFRAYPKDRPLVYVCSCNGVTGVVTAESFDTEVHRFRQNFGKHKDWPQVPIRPIVFPLFLFGLTKPNAKRDFRTGDLDDLNDLLRHCAVEERSFLVPAAYAEDWIPLNYPLASNSANGYEMMGCEGSRFTLHSLGEVRRFVLRGEPLRMYDLL